MLARALASAAGLALLGLAAVYAASEVRLSRVYPASFSAIAIPRDAASVERGRHLAVHVALCTWCHGDDLAGRPAADDPWVGRLHASNLTLGAGGIGEYSDLDLVRAIRHGVRPDGRSLLLMPSQYLGALRDPDLAAILAWLRTAPPVDAVQPAAWPGPLTRAALALGLAPELLAAEPREADTRDAGNAGTRDEGLGAYLVDVASCRVCHHADLAGGLHPLALPGEPPPPDLRPSGPLARWSFDDFRRAMRSGLTPDGRTLAPEYMPWPNYAGMTDAELEAIWAYLTRPT